MTNGHGAPALASTRGRSGVESRMLATSSIRTRFYAQALLGRENALFERLARRADFRRGLFRDGIPTPETYLAQHVRVLFAFREPNMKGRAREHDMRDEVRDGRFRPLMPDGTREERPASGWWNAKACSRTPSQRRSTANLPARGFDVLPAVAGTTMSSTTALSP